MGKKRRKKLLKKRRKKGRVEVEGKRRSEGKVRELLQ